MDVNLLHYIWILHYLLISLFHILKKFKYIFWSSKSFFFTDTGKSENYGQVLQ